MGDLLNVLRARLNRVVQGTPVDDGQGPGDAWVAVKVRSGKSTPPLNSDSEIHMSGYADGTFSRMSSDQ